MDVFDLQAKISLDTSGFKKNLDESKGLMTGFGNEIKGVLDGIGQKLAAVFAVDQISGFVEGAVLEFGRFEQLVGGIDALFGEDSGKKLKENAAKAFETAGLSTNEYLDTSTSFAASLIQELGGDTDAAVALVDKAITDMADNANTMGTDIGSIQHAYRGFAKDNYTMLDNLKLGYGGTKSEMARLINDTGILGDTVVEVSTMTQQGNFDELVTLDLVIEALHMKQEELKITGRTAEESFGTVEGSLNSLKAAWSNWKVGLGDKDADMSALTDNLLGTFETAAGNVLPVVEQIGESLMQVFTDLTGIDLTPVTEVFDGLKTTLSDIGTAFAEGGVSGAFDEITGKLSELTGLDLSGVTEAFTGIGEAISTIGAGFAEGGLGGGFDALVGQIEQLTGLDLSGVTEAFDSLSEAFAGIKESFETGGISGGITDLAAAFTELTGIDVTTLADNFLAMGQAFSGIGEAFADGGIAGALDMLARVFSDLTGVDLTGLAAGIGDFLGKFLTVDSSTMTSIGNAITAVVQAFSGIDLGGIISAAADALGLFIGAIDTIAEGAISFVAEVVAQLARDFNVWAPAVAAVAAGIGTFMGYLGAVSIIQNASAALTVLKTTFTGLFTVLSANPVGAVVSLFVALGTALVTAYTTNEDFRNGLQETWNVIKEGAIGVFESFTETLGNIGEAISEAASTIKEKASEFIEAGRDLIQGLVDGITEKVNAVKETVSGAFNKVVSWANNVFDRHSPSKVFAEIGRDLMRGLAVGIDDESGIVQDSIDKLRLTVPPVTTGRIDFADSAIGKASAATVNGMFASAGASSGGAQTINLVVDGRTLAQVVFDPLNGMIRQKGVAFGA